MKSIKIKLASNYQCIEFEVDSIDEDISDAISLVNELGKKVINTTSGKPAKIEEELATASQVEILKRYKVPNADKMSRTEAWKKIHELTK